MLHPAFGSLNWCHDFGQSLTVRYGVKVKILIPYNPATRSVVLNKERSGSHMGDICQCLETFLMVTSGLAGVGESEGKNITTIWQVEGLLHTPGEQVIPTAKGSFDSKGQ